MKEQWCVVGMKFTINPLKDACERTQGTCKRLEKERQVDLFVKITHTVFENLISAKVVRNSIHFAT